MKLYFTLIFILLSLSAFASESEELLKPFSSDYCTGYPEGTISHPKLWAKCCVEHDLYLWAGGSKRERKQTDENLRACVKQTGANINSTLIYLGVRIGSYSPIKFEDKKWGNGWKKERENRPLSLDEIELIEKYFYAHPSPFLSEEELSQFIKNLKIRTENSLQFEFNR